MDAFGKIILVDSMKTAVNELVKRCIASVFQSREEKVQLSKALTAINQAIIETKNFISSDGYKPNSELSKLWHEALNACIEAGIQGKLPQYLYHKANFWGTPKDWLDRPETLELVPKLKELKDECDSLLVKLNK